MKAYTYKEFTDHELVEGEVPADMLDKAKKYAASLSKTPSLKTKQCLRSSSKSVKKPKRS